MRLCQKQTQPHSFIVDSIHEQNTSLQILFPRPCGFVEGLAHQRCYRADGIVVWGYRIFANAVGKLSPAVGLLIGLKGTNGHVDLRIGVALSARIDEIQLSVLGVEVRRYG